MAFNIDIEVDGGADLKKYRIYCSSLTDSWNVEKAFPEIEAFVEDIKKEKIKAPPNPPQKDPVSIETYLGELGCNTNILKLQKFHEFLNIPQNLREGLSFVSDKPLGKLIKSGMLKKHSRYAQRQPKEKFCQLMSDDRGGTLLCYESDKSQNVIASLKIGVSTEAGGLPDNQIPNGFILKSGKRQWILEAPQSADYYSWLAQIRELLKQAGPPKPIKDDPKPSPSPKPLVSSTNETPAPVTTVNPANNANSNTSNVTSPSAPTSKPASTSAAETKGDKLMEENRKLKQQLDFEKHKEDNYKEEIDKLQAKISDMKSGKDDHRREIEAGLRKHMEEAQKDWEQQHENLKKEIEELHRKLNAKSAIESSKSEEKEFKEAEPIDPNEQEVQIDAEKRQLESLTPEVRSQIKFVHKHLHRHQDIHSHTHTHIHLGNDGVTTTTESLINSHHVINVMTHTNTQRKIKTAWF